MTPKALLQKLRKRREEAVFRRLESGILLENNVTVYWQPRVLVLLRVAVIVAFSYVLYEFHPYVSGLLASTVAFFKFEAIFRFQTPDASFYQMLGRGLTGALIIFYLAPPLYTESVQLLTSLAIDKTSGRVYIIGWRGWTREIRTLFGDQISGLKLKESPHGRLTGIGEIEIATSKEDTLRLVRLSRVRKAMRDLQAIRP